MTRKALIIGSGVSGMTTAVILAKAGIQVTVLEQHAKVGGLMQTYRRNGCRFPTGVHSLGAMNEGEILWRYFKYLGLLDLVRLRPLDDDAFLECSFPGQVFLIPPNRERFRENLLTAFPGEEYAVESFFRDLQAVVAQFPLYNLDGNTERFPNELASRSLQAYLDALSACTPLKSVLSSTNPLIGVAPAECPLYAHFLILDSFLRGSCRIDENHMLLADAFVAVLRGHGADIRSQARVVEILYDSEGVRGARLADGECLTADTVLFTGHPKQLLALCQVPGVLRPAYRQRIEAATDTAGVFGVGIAWGGDVCPFAGHDAVLYRTWDTGAHYTDRFVHTERAPLMVYCTASAPPGNGAYSLLALCLSDYVEWEPWADTFTGRRPAQYQRLKESAARRVISIMEERWPGIERQSQIVDTYTPLTLRDYLLSPQGSAYGISKSAKDLASRFSAVTRIKGLYLAGQSIILPGVLGAIISSVNACSHILGYAYLTEEIGKCSQ